MELEIGLHRWDAGGYTVELRCCPQDSDAEVQLVQGGDALAQFDFDTLRGLATSPDAYGLRLGESLFANPAVHTLFRQATSNAQAGGVPLRLRLFIGPTAPELHRLHWETLRAPEDGSLLFTGEQVFFSRYLSSQDWRRVRPRDRADLRALVVAANPAGLDDVWPGGRRLGQIDVEAELHRARTGLADIPVTALAECGGATLGNIVDQLRAGYDILYLVCHGAEIDGEPWLWLEDEAGAIAVVRGGELAARLRELAFPPRLVVLASCQSAGSGAGPKVGDEGALAALGPRLAEIGIPAVLAVQGNISIDTMGQFAAVFFRELAADGQIDRAAALARGAVRERFDSWMPVLYMRLRSGRISWYESGFVQGSEGFRRWPTLLPRIQEGTCTPILGPGLLEPLIGSPRALAQRWADQYSFPLAPDDRDDLPQVAQFLSVDHDERFPIEQLQRDLREDLLDRFATDLAGAPPRASLDELLARVWDLRQAAVPWEAHRVLAGFPFRLYITANADNLLCEALRRAGRQPEVVLCPWNEATAGLPSIYARDRYWEPTPERPLVYHLFGQYGEPDSLVLTEDDYFKYLIGVTANRDLIPEEVKCALADSALLFLGFQLDDWNFRVLFRSLIGQEGNARLKRYSHVGVQIAPEEVRMRDPAGARSYLESYFQGAKVNIFWGSTEDFLKRLPLRLTNGLVGPAEHLAGAPR